MADTAPLLEAGGDGTAPLLEAGGDGTAPANPPFPPRRFVALMGTVSAFGDATYEGARGLMGPWLAALGADAAAVGAVAGASELVSHAPRLLTGWLADAGGGRWRWPLTLAGYSVNVVAVPPLALVHGWPAAAALFLTERFGKAVRSPARSALVAPAARAMGGAGGAGFALDAILDTVGAVGGALMTAAVLAAATRGGAPASLAPYRAAFAALLLPALANVGLACVAAWSVPRPDAAFGAAAATAATAADDDGRAGHGGTPPHPCTPRRAFAALTAASALVAAGVIDFALIAFHCLEGDGATTAAPHHRPHPPSPAHVSVWVVPLLYAFSEAAGIVAVAAAGRSLDRVGGGATLAACAVASAAVAPLVFLFGGGRAHGGGAVGGRDWRAAAALAAGVALNGGATGARTAATAATVAAVVPAGGRGRAYGALAAVTGVCWAAGSAAAGALYKHHSPRAVAALSVGLQAAAVPLFLGMGV